MEPIIKTLFTSDDETELIRLGDAISLVCFRVGDIANEKIALLGRRSCSGNVSEAVRKSLLQISYIDVYKYIASLVGRSERSVRKYAAVSKFYPPEIRTQFGPLKFAHFEAAMQYGSAWRTVLETALQQMDYFGGKPPTVEWIEHNFKDPEPEAVAFQSEVIDARPRINEELPDRSGDDPVVFVLNTVRKLIRGVLEKAQVSRPVLNKLNMILDIIEDAVKEVA